MLTAVAFSGGPASTAVLRALPGPVTAVVVDLGQGGGVVAAAVRAALAAGASDAVVVDARDAFADDHCLPALRANAPHADPRPLGAALTHPALATHLVRAAEHLGATRLAHGRPDSHLAAALAGLAPGALVPSPRTPTTAPPMTGLSATTSLWDRPGATPPEPAEPTIAFDRGTPVALDGETHTARQLLQELARRTGAPAARALTTAHRALEQLTLTPAELRLKRLLDRRWTQLVHAGGWSTPLRRDLDAELADTQHHVTGRVTLRLGHGPAVVTARADDPPVSRRASTGQRCRMAPDRSAPVRSAPAEVHAGTAS
ncbi:argininosuccinate synthase [Actinosynnema pretiosum subsp. pretiosum]|uniref:argininosuccinate synthase n=2 Tax=Actinosynnema TaxID=40566 RepID=C6WA80_ACTMD|nr:argininosuccinate synthase domain-containing protein [Actinosynnema mirum]ACU39269.1 Argininosuccinate synthase [Actinosynnema mirum DSM 43827]QUF03263.1 argininosuccinate synthase [Actinosynnema pretiosum subsp. pretiosum]